MAPASSNLMQRLRRLKWKGSARARLRQRRAQLEACKASRNHSSTPSSAPENIRSRTVPSYRECVEDGDNGTDSTGCTVGNRNDVTDPSSNEYEQKCHCADLEQDDGERDGALLIFDGYAMYGTDSEEDGAEGDGGRKDNAEGEDEVAVTNYEGDDEAAEDPEAEQEDEDDDVPLSAYFGMRGYELQYDMALVVPNSDAEAEDAAALQMEKV